MVESVLSTLVGLPGSFPKSILEQLFCRGPVVPASAQRNSAADII